VTNMTWRWP